MVSNGHPCRRYSETWPPLPGAGLDRFPAPFVLRAQKKLLIQTFLAQEIVEEFEAALEQFRGIV
jgi:hypothetical protein